MEIDRLLVKQMGASFGVDNGITIHAKFQDYKPSMLDQFSGMISRPTLGRDGLASQAPQISGPFGLFASRNAVHSVPDLFLGADKDSRDAVERVLTRSQAFYHSGDKGDLLYALPTDYPSGSRKISGPKLSGGV